MDIEVKKYPSADLDNYQGLIFSISLLITMSLVITAFEWKSYEQSMVELQGKAVNSFEILAEIPPSEIPPAPEPVKTPLQFVEMPDEEEIIEEVKISIDVEMNQDTRIEKININPVLPVIEEEKEDEIFTIVETPAEPAGGLAAFYKDISERIKYPAQARRMQVEGRVFVEFVVNKDGSLTDIRVVKGIGAGCDEQAVLVLQTAPKWKPGKQRGVPVRQRMVLPITFQLSSF
ncbi:MAG: TonB family protein [Cyclobacteriaceae bacterium]